MKLTRSSFALLATIALSQAHCTTAMPHAPTTTNPEPMVGDSPCACTDPIDLQAFLPAAASYEGKCVAVLAWLRTEADPTYLFLSTSDGSGHALTLIADTLVIHPAATTSMPTAQFYAERRIVCGRYRHAGLGDGQHARGAILDATFLIIDQQGTLSDAPPNHGSQPTGGALSIRASRSIRALRAACG